MAAQPDAPALFTEPTQRPAEYMPFPPNLAPHANEVEQPAPAVLAPVAQASDGVSVVPALSPVGSFIVSRVRHDGTSYARVTFTRAELEQLVCAASEALK